MLGDNTGIGTILQITFLGYPLKLGQEILVNAVIPARMPVSSAMEGNFPITLQYDLGSMLG